MHTHVSRGEFTLADIQVLELLSRKSKRAARVLVGSSAAGKQQSASQRSRRRSLTLGTRSAKRFCCSLERSHVS